MAIAFHVVYYYYRFKLDSVYFKSINFIWEEMLNVYTLYTVYNTVYTNTWYIISNINVFIYFYILYNFLAKYYMSNRLHITYYMYNIYIFSLSAYLLAIMIDKRMIEHRMKQKKVEQYEAASLVWQAAITNILINIRGEGERMGRIDFYSIHFSGFVIKSI